MKRIILLALLVVAGTMIIWSQVPQAMNYKAIAKDDWGVSLPNKTITLRFTILQGSETGLIVYQETHRTTTNKFGLMDVEIGKGTPIGSSFDVIDWSTGIYYIKIEMDPNGGTNFRLEDTAHQLLSVPYALYANNSGNVKTETDPVYTSSPSSGIWSSDISNWNTAFSWGNHANEGYLKSFTEFDPIFLLHPAHGIASENINNWNAAYGWGDHTGLYKPLNWMPAWNEITENPFLISSPLANQLLKYNAVTARWENWSADYLITEVDGSVTNEIQTLSISGNIITLTDGGSVTLPNMTGLFYYADRDNDGYGDAFSPVWVPSGVEPPAHFIPDNTDCNDNNPSINPGSTETPDDLDNNCDGLIDNYQCSQFSSFPALHSGEFSVTVNQFCFNLPDIPSNGQCTIHVETEFAGPWVYIDAYADNTMVASNDGLLVFEVEQGLDYKVILRNTPHLDVLSFGPYTVTVSFETIDIDGDGYTVAEGDCNDTDPTIHPGAIEIMGDGIDQDCDGTDQTGLPSSFDWRSYNGSNWMTPVKNQGSCGSCFAVAAVAAFEAKIKIQSNRPDLVIDLSEQEYLSCGLIDFNCNGGYIQAVLNYIRDYGIVEESVFPYNSGVGAVPACIPLEGQKKYKLTEWETLPNSMDGSVIKEALINKGPILFYTYVSNLFYTYTGGILLPLNEGSGINKTMLLIGYNDTERYWIVENTWGSSWGENGYYKLSYDATSYSMPYKYVITSVAND